MSETERNEAEVTPTPVEVPVQATVVTTQPWRAPEEVELDEARRKRLIRESPLLVGTFALLMGGIAGAVEGVRCLSDFVSDAKTVSTQPLAAPTRTVPIITSASATSTASSSRPMFEGEKVSPPKLRKGKAGMLKR